MSCRKPRCLPDGPLAGRSSPVSGVSPGKRPWLICLIERGTAAARPPPPPCAETRSAACCLADAFFFGVDALPDFDPVLFAAMVPPYKWLSLMDRAANAEPILR